MLRRSRPVSRSRVSLALAAFSFVACAASGWTSAAAEPATSAYTRMNARDCRKVDSVKTGGDEIASDLACKGFGGLVVLRQMDDERETMSVGRSAKAAATEPAAAQGFGPFNSTGDAVEWRLSGNGKPFAVIQRWHISDNTDIGPDNRPRSVPMLVVMRLAPACHVAYVDATANAAANDVARQAADEWARDFDCKAGSIHIGGHGGRAVELALPPKR